MSIIVTTVNNLPEALKILTGDLSSENSYSKKNAPNLKMPTTIDEARKRYSKASDSAAADSLSGSTIEATPEIAAIIDDLNRLEELKQELLASEERLKVTVMNFMQYNNMLTFNDKYLVSWKSYDRNNFDLKAFKTEFPEMYGLYLKETSSRVFKLY